MLIYGIVIFLLVTVGSMTLLNWLIPNKSQRRLQQLAQGAGDKSDWVKTVVGLAGPLAKLSTPEGKWEDSPTRLRFINAGIRNPNAVIVYYAAKTLLPFLFAVMAYAGLQISGISLERNTLLLALLVAATIGCYLPNIILSRTLKNRQREIFENFPDEIVFQTFLARYDHRFSQHARRWIQFKHEMLSRLLFERQRRFVVAHIRRGERIFEGI